MAMTECCKGGNQSTHCQTAQQHTAGNCAGIMLHSRMMQMAVCSLANSTASRLYRMRLVMACLQMLQLMPASGPPVCLLVCAQCCMHLVAALLSKAYAVNSLPGCAALFSAVQVDCQCQLAQLFLCSTAISGTSTCSAERFGATCAHVTCPHAAIQAW